VGRTSPKQTNPFTQAAWRDRAVQAVFGVVVWWAVYYRVSAHYGLGGGMIAATCAAWAYVAVCACASYLLNQRGAGSNRPGGSGGSGGSGGNGGNGRSGGSSGRWPGAAP
jgi:hypothetical protein